MIHKSASELSVELAKMAESKLMDQLNWLVIRGILVIESTQPVLVMDDDNKITMSQTVELCVKDKEYIERLEQRIEHLEDYITITKGTPLE